MFKRISVLLHHGVPFLDWICTWLILLPHLCRLTLFRGVSRSCWGWGVQRHLKQEKINNLLMPAAWIYSKNLTEKLISKSHEKFRFMVTITIRFPHLHCLVAHYCTYGGHPSFSHILNLPYLANQTTLRRPTFQREWHFSWKKAWDCISDPNASQFLHLQPMHRFQNFIIPFAFFIPVSVSAPFFGRKLWSLWYLCMSNNSYPMHPQLKDQKNVHVSGAKINIYH